MAMPPTAGSAMGAMMSAPLPCEVMTGSTRGSTTNIGSSNYAEHETMDARRANRERSAESSRKSRAEKEAAAQAKLPQKGARVRGLWKRRRRHPNRRPHRRPVRVLRPLARIVKVTRLKNRSSGLVSSSSRPSKKPSAAKPIARFSIVYGR